ncbi:MAG: hypothetical protein KTR30_09100, partial [Saprospiraceae bacterium]|nr:hypothetical protein [Saprospiraceae bacterium]
RSYVVVQRNLVKSVLYWYILPLVPGLVVFYLSMESWLAISISATISAMIFVFVYRLNQRAAKENYEHLLKDLDRAIQSLEI